MIYCCYCTLGCTACFYVMTKSSLRKYMVTPGDRHGRRLRQRAAFTLVEVVIALGIFSFAIITIAGLFLVGINTNKDSSDQIQAANIASLLISTRRAMPTNTITSFAIGPLNTTYSSAGTYLTNTGGVALDGTTTGTPAYNLFYQAGTNTVAGPHLSTLHLILWWPVRAPMPTNNAAGRYELTTEVALP
jgi:uncharacterized protein (TIGR02598 family)